MTKKLDSKLKKLQYTLNLVDKKGNYTKEQIDLIVSLIKEIAHIKVKSKPLSMDEVDKLVDRVLS